MNIGSQGQLKKNLITIVITEILVLFFVIIIASIWLYSASFLTFFRVFFDGVI
jgi:hypothetical protein